MQEATSRNIKLGLFVVAGTALLILALYLIGSKQNLFGSTIRLHASFQNVNGLMPGNNVRFSGIDVGTVVKVDILNDSTVGVEMIIEDDVQPFIRKNALAAVGTDGLMGDKLINIYPVNEPSEIVADGDQLRTRDQVGTDEMMRTLSVTNENVREISSQIKQIVTRLNKPNSLWSILMDTTLSENVRSALVSIRLTGDRTALLTGDLQQIARDIRSGKGTIGALITDTSISNGLKQSIVSIRLLSDSVASVTGDLNAVMDGIREGKGAIGTLLLDTTFARNLNLTMENIQRGTRGFDENMEGLKQSIFLRKYFRKKKK
jgi:phospholipid/cholesterol/gamma-HCH transport system substrate-binding protein